MKKLLLMIALSFTMTSAAWAATRSPEFDKGLEAYNKGDYSKAFSHFSTAGAPKEDNPDAQYYMGLIYRDGKSGVKSQAIALQEAVKWWKLAGAESTSPSGRPMGNKEAQLLLGIHYQITEKKYTDAAFWYKRAAANGKMDGQYNLGVMYENGQGVPKDLIRAHIWMNVALQFNNNADIRKALERVNAKLTKPQLAQAQKLAAACHARASGRPKIGNYYRDCTTDAPGKD